MIGVDSIKPSAKTEPQIPCLAMRLREAAKAIGVSERTLWKWVDKGEVPHIRRGKVILLPVDSLRKWLKHEAEQGMEKTDGKNFEKS
jgi:excisionase family DNA binding protein